MQKELLSSVGESALTTKSRLLLSQILTQNEVGFEIIQHPASISAIDKHRILPHFLIQKTITLEFSGKFVLCSTLIDDDRNLTRPELRAIAKSIGISNKKASNCFVNPPKWDPKIHVGLQEGIVSTFFEPNLRTELNAVVLLPPKTQLNHNYRGCAISLNPHESLVIPTKFFASLAKSFAYLSYPQFPFIDFLNI